MTRPQSGHLCFVDAIKASPQSKAFQVLIPDADDAAQRDRFFEQPAQWQLQPLDVAVLSDDGNGGGFYIAAALHVLPSGHLDACFLDVSFPERINDYAYFIRNDHLIHDYTFRFPGEVIPAIAFDCFGQYDMFYAKSAPEIGIDVLKRGLAVSKRKRFIAQDLGYILRDEKHWREAAEMFELVVAEEAPSYSSYFMYYELAQLYEQLGDAERQAKYSVLCNRRSRGGA
jgi:hypothetical protein